MQCAKALMEDYIQNIQVKLHASVHVTFTVFIGDIVQADSEKSSNLPKDGTVHELTSSVSVHSIDIQCTHL